MPKRHSEQRETKLVGGGGWIALDCLKNMPRSMLCSGRLTHGQKRPLAFTD